MGNKRKSLPYPAALKSRAQSELRSLAAMLKQAKAGDSVHGARRRIKALRSLLRLLRLPLGEDAYAAANAALREAADALAGQRRVEALAAAAAKLDSGCGEERFWLERAQFHRAAHDSDRKPREELALAREAIGRAGLLLRQTRLAPHPEDTVRRALTQFYRKARKRLRSALESGDAEELHEARKLVIHHQHHLMLLNGEAKKRVAALETLRESLGDLNDLDELEQLAQAQGMLPVGKAALRMSKTRARLLARARGSARRLFRRKPGTYAKGLAGN